MCHVSICWLVDDRSHCKMLRMCSPPSCETCGASFVVELRLQWARVPRAGLLWLSRFACRLRGHDLALAFSGES